MTIQRDLPHKVSRGQELLLSPPYPPD